MWTKVSTLGLPIMPDEQTSTWIIEAQIEFEAVGKPVIVNLDIPNSIPGYTRLDESFVSRNYGLSIDIVNKDRRAEWSVRRAKGLQRLYYRLDLAADLTESGSKKNVRAPAPPPIPDYPEPFASAVQDLLQSSRDQSADVFTFVSQLVSNMNNDLTDSSAALIHKGVQAGTEKWVQRITYVLAGARIPARLVRGIVLTKSNGRTPLLNWLEVHNGEQWQGIDPLSGSKGYPDNFVRWSVGDDPLLTIKGGHNVQLHHSISQQPQSLVNVAHERAEAMESTMLGLTLLKLPLATQNIYRILLMIPIGALIVVIMRVLIGIPTFGTFMPILIALAFRETSLLWGIGLFCLIVGSGLALRFYLEKLQLLLVPRLSAVLALVILLMLLLSLLSHELDFEYGIYIGLFPIVIITMVIERMSILWSESGALEAYKTGFGSLLVATITYFVMNNNYLEHWFFMFPELLLLMLALFLWAGRYTGYRLNELIRFRELAK
ncbi:MAG: UUP1 family membrane protein [Gammaproteobacteria bacterium]|nr:UUP1 family membrane protein [Gammaproteobacteria bacterium]